MAAICARPCKRRKTAWAALAARLALKEELPYPSKPKRGQRLIPVPLWVAPKIALYWAIREAGVNNVQLARRLAFGKR